MTTKRAAFLLACAVLFGASLEAQGADDFYKGKTLKIIAGTSAGSGTDAYVRLIQQYLGRHIPGNPTIVVENMPAGGGLAADNHIYNVADRDGSEIGLFNRNSLFSRMLGDENARFDLERFNWIGTPSSFKEDAWVFMIRSELPYRNFGELRHAEPPLNVGGVDSTNPFIRMLQGPLAVKMKLVVGYPSQQLALAFERSEINGVGNAYLSVLATTPDLLSHNIGRIMVQFGHAERLPALSNVPTGDELAGNSEDLALIKLADSSLTLGFPVAAPPGVPDERVAILRAAFRDTMADAAYQSDSQKLKLSYSPRIGEQFQADLVRLAETPPSIVNRYKLLMTQ